MRRAALGLMTATVTLVGLHSIAWANVTCSGRTPNGTPVPEGVYTSWGPGGANFDPDSWVHCRFDRDVEDVASGSYAGANCNDGKAAGFSVLHWSSASANNKKFLVYLQGGQGTQYQTTELTKRLIAGEGSYFANAVNPSNGIFNKNLPDNPFAGWTKVFLRACSNDGWAGNGGKVRLATVSGYDLGDSGVSLDMDVTSPESNSTYTVHDLPENACGDTDPLAPGSAALSPYTDPVLGFTYPACNATDTHADCKHPLDCCDPGTGGEICDHDFDHDGVVTAGVVTISNRPYPATMLYPKAAPLQSRYLAFAFNGQRIVEATLGALGADSGVNANIRSNFTKSSGTSVVLSGSSTGGFGTLVNAFRVKDLLTGPGGNALKGIYVDALNPFWGPSEEATPETDFVQWKQVSGASTGLLPTDGQANEAFARREVYATICGTHPAGGVHPPEWCLDPTEVVAALDSGQNTLPAFFSDSAMDSTIRKCDGKNGIQLAYNYCKNDPAGLTDEASLDADGDGFADCVPGEDASYAPNYCESIGYSPSGAGKAEAQADAQAGALAHAGSAKISFWIEKEVTDNSLPPVVLADGHHHMHATESKGFNRVAGDPTTYFDVVGAGAGTLQCLSGAATSLGAGRSNLGSALTTWVGGTNVKAFCPLNGAY